ncbi:hypothetical protein HWV62_28575 [Athelia sp. TMB]|nr:hypothetical protein HWV62_21200 [Athelia sp. TMB]KAF7982438.1 hypothetical protein HWV62_28575 [Athelia sp. TMB]
MLFGLSDTEAWPTWRSTDYFPVANGFVRLGPKGRAFGISMFHQMHCLQMMRAAVLDNSKANSHTRHCFNLLRQAVLCAADTTLDPLDAVDENSNVGADGVGVVHQCRDWEKVYDYVIENQGLEIWNKTSTKAPASVMMPSMGHAHVE